MRTSRHQQIRLLWYLASLLLLPFALATSSPHPSLRKLMNATLRILLLFTLCPAQFSVIAFAADPPNRPNFIFFITDDISADDLSVYGNKAIATPNLDSLAAMGLVFDRAYLTISSCSPSRCSMITGRYPHNTGAPELHTELPEDQTTFVQVLQQAGYHTVLSGKNHMGKPERLGFDLASNSNPAGSEKWVEHLQQRPKDKPFFCWFASHDAHRAFTINDKAPVYAPEDVSVPPMLFDGPESRKKLAGYYHEIARTDYYMGELLKELESQQVLDNTYIIYCSDNGRPFPRCKTYLYDSGIKTPLIVAGPTVENGRTNSLVSSIDFAATILDLAGATKPISVQGVSIAPVLQSPSAVVRNVAFSERNWHVYQTHERSVRIGDWLYIWNAWPELYNVSGESSFFSFEDVREFWDAAEAGKLTEAQALLTKKPQPQEMLFNVASDPDQFNNLAGGSAHAEQLSLMRELLARWQEETADCVPTDPTLDRQALHDGGKQTMRRGEFPGAARGAASINAPGPVLVPLAPAP